MALIFALSSFEIPEIPFARFAMRDKIAHAFEYAGLGVFVAHAVLRTWPDRSRARLFSVAVLIAGAWGVLDEIHQAFVPGRSADVLDAVADVLGATAGAAPRLLLFSHRARSLPTVRREASP
jgi:VanZ family protein